jgi:Flp pilus assembly protein TadD
VGCVGVTGCVTGVPNAQAARVYYDLGNAYSQLGQNDKAATAYLNALSLDQKLVEADYNLARAYISSGRYADARSILDTILVNDPTNILARNALGYAFYKSGDKATALAEYDTVLMSSPLDVNALYNSGVILGEQGKLDDAAATLHKVYEVSNDATVLYPLAKIEFASKNIDAAITDLNAYLSAKPDDLEAVIELAGAYRDNEEFDKALSEYDTALQLKANDPDVLFQKASILLVDIQDGPNGLKTLEQSVAAGFSDRSLLKALVANDQLVDKDAVSAYLVSRGLVAKPSGS